MKDLTADIFHGRVDGVWISFGTIPRKTVGTVGTKPKSLGFMRVTGWS